MSDTPILDLTQRQWNSGCFFALVGSLHYPTMQAASIAHRMHSVRPAQIHPNDLSEIVRAARALESAALALREIAAIGKPAPVLVAAE